MTTSNTVPTRRGGWFRKLAWVAGILVVLLVVAWFVVTSGAFFKSFILPKVGAAMNSEVTVSDASISPFSQVVLKNLKVTPRGKETLLAADEIRLRYSLGAILGGNVKVDEIAFASPTVSLVQEADGSSNLDPILQGRPAGAKQPEPSATPAKPLQVAVTKVALNNGTVRLVKNYAGGKRDLTGITGLNVTLENLKNGGAGKLDFAAALGLDFNPPAPGTNASLQATAKGGFTFELTDTLAPKSVKGSARLDITSAGGAFTDAGGLASVLDSELTPTEIKQLAFRLQKAGADLAALTVTGPFDPTKQEGKLTVALGGVDKQALNLAGAKAGLNFNDTLIGSTNVVELAQGGKLVTVNGRTLAAKFSVTQQGLATPVLDFTAAYDLTVDQAKSNALIRVFDVIGAQAGRELLRGALSRPMLVNWSGSADAVEESVLDLAVNGLNLADWRAFAAGYAPAGTLNAKLNVVSQQAGKKLKLDLTAQLADFAAKYASNQIDNADATFAMRADVDDFRKVQLSALEARFAHQKQPALNFSTTGNIDTQTQDTDLQTKAEVLLPRLAALLGNPSLVLTAGTLQFDGQVKQVNTTPAHTNNPAFDRTVAGSLRLGGLTGRYGDYAFDRFEALADCDVQMKGAQADIRKLNATLRQAGQPGGVLNASGNWNTEKNAGTLTLQVADLNQNTLRSFLATALGEKKLASISINGKADANFASLTDATVKGGLTMTNFVVNDPSGQIPNQPLDVSAGLDLSLVKQVLDLRQCSLALAPTARARNEVALTGKVDMTQSNAITGALKLAAESIDVTPYYDLFAKPAPGPGVGAASKPAAGAQAAKPPQEPEPVKLPLKNFTCEAAIGKFYLREIEITNWLTTVKLDTSRVVVSPVALAFNGAPVKAAMDFDLSERGWKYDVSASADRIPLEPIVNSFSPQYRGQAKGDVLANLKITGAGITDASLQKSLAGETSFVLTNASVQLFSNFKLPMPQRLRPLFELFNPVVSILKPVMTAAANYLHLPELTGSPVQWMTAAATMGDGKINVTSADLASSAFTAGTGGEIVLASVLTNSTLQNWPVNLSLGRSLAQKLRVASASTPTNVAYVALPSLFKVAGTVGAPKTSFDAAGFTKLTLQALTANPSLGNSKAGALIQGIGGMLAGEKPATNAIAPGTRGGPTNAPAKTNPPASPLGNLLDLLNQPKKK